MIDEVLTSDDERLLDRLVDGELSETERRELLLRLERAPDGWRRCALAFLEAQVWRGEAKSWVNEPAPGGAKPQARVAAQRGWHGASTLLAYATAAAVLLAGTIVLIKDRMGDTVARIEVADGQTVEIHETGSRSSPQPRQNPNQNLRLVVNEGAGEENVVDVPLVDAGRMNEALFGQWQQSLPPEVVRMLEQSGHQVVRERRLVPIDLRDGRRVVVPMDQVEIRPVSIGSFQ